MSIWTNAPKSSSETYEVLTECAAYMYTITYEDLADRVASVRRDKKRPSAVSLRLPLGFIRDHICRPKGLPWLNALAVNKQTLLPGESFIPAGARGRKSNPKDEFLWWRGMVLQVYAYPWDQLEL